MKGSNVSLRDAIKSHASASKKLKADLAEAKNERIIDSRVRGRKLELYDAAVGSLTRLAQHLSGLRGSTRLQEGLIMASREGKVQLELFDGDRGSLHLPTSVMDRAASPGARAVQDMDVRTSAKLFLQFRDMAGNEMDVLVVRVAKISRGWRAHRKDDCQEALEAVQSISKRKHQTGDGVSDLRHKLASSLRKFNVCSSRAIKRLYAGPRRQKGVYEHSIGSESEDEHDSKSSVSIDIEDHDEGPNETVFLIYL